MSPKLSVIERLEGQIAEKSKYLCDCEEFLEQATKELEKAPWNEHLQRKVQTLGGMVFSTKQTINALQKMLRELH